MTRTIIYNTDQFTVTSWGNGLSYGFVCKESGENVFLQGDDAAQFREELEALEEARPDASTNAVLSYLWSIYDLVAEPMPLVKHPFNTTAPLAAPIYGGV